MHTHLTSQRLDELLASNEAASLSPEARQKLEWISVYMRGGRSISDICVHLNIARSTFHRWLKKFDPENLRALEEKTRDPLAPRQSHISQDVIGFIRAYRQRDPHMGKEQIRMLLQSEHNVELSSSTIGRIIERECLYFGGTPLHWRKRVQHQQTTGGRPVIIAAQQPAVMAAAPAPVTGWPRHKKHLIRSVVATSILVNLVLAGMFAATLVMERRDAETLGANVVGSDNYIHSAFDPSYDDR